MSLYNRIEECIVDIDTLAVLKGFKAEIEAMEDAVIDAEEELLWLNCLEAAGVDNWVGFDFAKEIMAERTEEATA
jgi:hypothetical protein